MNQNYNRYNTRPHVSFIPDKNFRLFRIHRRLADIHEKSAQAAKIGDSKAYALYEAEGNLCIDLLNAFLAGKIFGTEDITVKLDGEIKKDSISQSAEGKRKVVAHVVKEMGRDISREKDKVVADEDFRNYLEARMNTAFGPKSTK